MSFRLRIFLLVMLVALTAIGATAWLTLRLTSGAVTRAEAAAVRHQNEIIDTVARFGLTHGRWPGLDRLAVQLSDETRLHLQLNTFDGDVLVDTDNLKGRVPGAVRAVPVLVDPRPQLSPAVTHEPYATGPKAKIPVYRDISRLRLFDTAPKDPLAGSPPAMMIRQLTQYRGALIAVRCIHDRDPAQAAALQLDTAPYLTAAQLNGYPDCVRTASNTVATDTIRLKNDWAAYDRCVALNQDSSGSRGCLESAFSDRVGATAAVPLQLYLGAPPDSALGRLGRPAAFGVAGLILVALLGTALIARRVSQPVRRLTEASRLLAAGRLEVRVPDTGRGELARLSASFNAMSLALQRSEERQRRLVADVAHEMRTPLSNLRGYLEGLADGVVQPSRELFVSLHEETLLQRRILDDLEVLALAEAGHLGYARTPLDLSELVRTATTAQQVVAAEAGLTLSAEAPAPVPVDADPDRLRQVLGNLLTNAIRYTDAGGRVLVRAYPDHGAAVLTVQDTGVGIAAPDLPRVFDRFWRADPARQRATGGSGLGLTIAFRIVADHDGRIDVASEPGIGTIFTVRLPLRGPQLSVDPQFSADPRS